MLALAALLSHPAMPGGMQRTRAILDGLAVAAALLLLSWMTLLGPLWRHTDHGTLGGLVTLAYPFSDVLIMFLIVLTVRRMAGERLAAWCLLGGLLAIALSDSAFAYLIEVAGFESGTLLDAGWFAGYLMIGLGAFVSREALALAAERSSTAPALAPVVAPFLPILAALGFTGLKVELVRELDDVSLVTAFCLVLLVLARQVLLIRDMTAGGLQGDLGQRLHDALTVRARVADASPSSAPREGSST